MDLMRKWKASEELRKGPNEAYWTAFQKEYEARLKRLMSYQWGLGFNDRGHGHGDFAVVVQFNYRTEVVVQCPFAAIAEHIMTLHNESLPEKLVEPPLKVRCIDVSWERDLIGRCQERDPKEESYIENDPENILKLGQIYEVVYINEESEFEIPCGSSGVCIPQEMFEIIDEGIGLENIPQYRPCGKSSP